MSSDHPMQLGMIGLGRMGANLVRRLMADGHRCVVYDVNAEAVSELAAEGATGAGTLAEFVAALDAPRAVWIMVPAGFVQGTVDELVALLDADDVVIDGGNSYYRDDIARAAQLSAAGHPLRGLRHERRRVGSRSRLLPDDRGRRRRGGSARSRSGARSHPARATSRRLRAATGPTAPHRWATCTAGPVVRAIS